MNAGFRRYSVIKFASHSN